MEERRNAPKLRFPGFTDPWEQRRLGEIGSARSGVGFPNAEQGGSEGTPFYKVSDMNLEGNEFQLRRANNYVTDEQIERKRWKPINEVPAMFFAKVGAAVLLNRKRLVDEPFLLDNNTMAYSFNRRFWDVTFGRILFDGLDLTSLVQVGALPSYNASDIESMEVAIPLKIAEQTKIGALFQRLDSLIALHQRELDHVKELKKGLLQKMFPKEGANVPELRSPGFTDPWEQRRLGELCSFAKGRGYSKIDIRDSGVPLILYGRLYTQYQTKIEEVDTFTVEKDGSLLSKGNEVIVPASGETAEDIAVASSVRRPGIIFGGDLNVLTPGDALDPDYVALGITYGSAHSNLAKRAQGKSVVHVHNADIAMTELAYPSIDEQRAISILVLKLDSLIALHQRELDHVKELKKGLLQQMFV